VPSLSALGFTPTPGMWIAAVLTLFPLLLAGLVPKPAAWIVKKLPPSLRIVAPGLLCIPYALVVRSRNLVHVGWLLLYMALPIAIAWMLWHAKLADRAHRGDWRDFLVLALLGLAVDLRWFERAWPPHLAIFSKMILLDAGIYGFVVIRQLDGVGFSLLLRKHDVVIGFREFAWYLPIALTLGLWLQFLHVHATLPRITTLLFAYIFTFLFIAIPEELFFRGWLQNLLERRLGRWPALLLTSILFGLSHFNKRAVHFNWRYVLLAAIAGLFYGRAWRQERRVGASAITHTCVDTVWSQWLR
jgi:membrane protease YdiL (CAAX protease family)